MELVFILLVVAIIAAVALPQSLAAIDRIRAAAATRYLASRMASARAQAVRRSATVAMRFERAPTGFTFRTFVDGNGNGVRTTDIEAAVDLPIDGPGALFDLFPGVDIAVAGSAGSDPVRLGATDLLSFTPLGTATAGSIYVRGRDRSQYAIRILGTTGRTRIQRYVERTGRWTDTF
jgi:type II secretory pathway pseudopilin PulG